MTKYAIIRSYNLPEPVSGLFFSTPSEAWGKALEWHKDTGLRPARPSTWNILAFEDRMVRNLTDAEWDSIKVTEESDIYDLYLTKNKPSLEGYMEPPNYTVVSIYNIYDCHGSWDTPQSAWNHARNLVDSGKILPDFTILALDLNAETGMRVMTDAEWASIQISTNYSYLVEKAKDASVGLEFNTTKIKQDNFKQIMYGLRVKGEAEPLKVCAHPVPDLISYRVARPYYVELAPNCNCNEIWMEDTIAKAKIVQHGPFLKSTSCFSRPWHNYKPEQLEVVRIHMEVEVVQ